MIKQIFHLPKDFIKKIEKSKKPQKDQLKIEETLSTLKERCQINSFNLELLRIEESAQQILQLYDKAIIIGIGGALLASRAFVAIENYCSKNFHIIYSDSLSLKKQTQIFTKHNLATSAIIIISRSGNSVETLSQAHSIIQKYKEFFGAYYLLGKHFLLSLKEIISLLL